MQIDPNGRTVQGLTAFLEFVALNVLFLLSCLPIVTIGAATSALYEVTMRYADEERGRPVRDFFPALVRNFWRATAVFLCLAPPLVVLVFSAAFWLALDDIVSGGAAVLVFLAALFLFVAFLYAMALIARYQSGFRATLKNAVLFPGAEPLRTGVIALIPATALCLTVLYPPFAFLLLTVMFSVGAYASAFAFLSAFRRQEEHAAQR